MANRRTISWTAAMRDLRNDRARRAGVREERLRATAGLRSGALALSSWRGRSGRRYVVGIHPLSESEILEVREAVIIAVRRDRDGVAQVIDVAAAGSEIRERARTAWMMKVRACGATEMHVHRLAEGDEERRAIIADLTDAEPAALPEPQPDAPAPDR
jgi:hypothetical protein